MSYSYNQSLNIPDGIALGHTHCHSIRLQSTPFLIAPIRRDVVLMVGFLMCKVSIEDEEAAKTIALQPRNIWRRVKGASVRWRRKCSAVRPAFHPGGSRSILAFGNLMQRVLFYINFTHVADRRSAFPRSIERSWAAVLIGCVRCKLRVVNGRMIDAMAYSHVLGCAIRFSMKSAEESSHIISFAMIYLFKYTSFLLFLIQYLKFTRLLAVHKIYYCKWLCMYSNMLCHNKATINESSPNNG